MSIATSTDEVEADDPAAPSTPDDGASWPLRPPPGFRWYEFVTIAVLAAGFVAIGLYAIMLDSPMGHDESLYSARAREMQLNEPRGAWALSYRAPGLSVAYALSPLGLGDSRNRIVMLGFGILAIVAIWLLARTVVNVPTGLLAAGLLAITPNQVLVSTLGYPDVPGAAMGILALAVLAWALTRPRLPWWTWTMVPLAMAATWIRFGAPMAIGVAAATMLAFAWPRVRPQLGRVVLLGAATAAGAGAILLVPALTDSTQPPLTAIRNFGAQKVKIFTRTLGDFWEASTPVLGVPLRVLIVGAVVIVVVTLLLGAPRLGWDRGGIWAFVAMVATVAILSRTLSLGQGRYLSPALPLLWIAVAAVLVRIGRHVHPATSLVALVALVGFSIPAILDRVVPVHTDLGKSFNLLREAGRDIRDDPELPCPVITSYLPQLEWYSECDAIGFHDTEVVPPGLDTESTLVVVQRGKRQPPPEVLGPVMERGEVVAVYDNGGDQRADRITLVRMPPDPDS